MQGYLTILLFFFSCWFFPFVFLIDQSNMRTTLASKETKKNNNGNSSVLDALGQTGME